MRSSSPATAAFNRSSGVSAGLARMTAKSTSLLGLASPRATLPNRYTTAKSCERVRKNSASRSVMASVATRKAYLSHQSGTTMNAFRPQSRSQFAAGVLLSSSEVVNGLK